MSRIALAAFGDPGHAFPMLALGRALRARGNEVSLQTARKWRDHVEGEDLRFAAAPEFPVVVMENGALKPFDAVIEALPETRRWLEEFAPDVLAHDILTLAPALAAEQLGVPTATVIPHVNPVSGPHDPPYGIGIRPPRTPLGKLVWSALSRPIERGLRQGEREYLELRRRAGLRPRPGLHSALSEQRIIVATFPQLEYSPPGDDRFRVIGPLFWEPPYEDVELPTGEEPLVLVAPSTAQDPDHRLLTAALDGLGELDCRVIATWNRRPLKTPPRIPANTNLVEWLSYSRTMPQCAAVVSHAGHGTLARTLQSGAVPVLVPYAGDQFENAARSDAMGLGVRLPNRLLSGSTLRLAVERALKDPRLQRNCGEVANWSATHDGAAAAAELILELAEPDEPT